MSLSLGETSAATTRGSAERVRAVVPPERWAEATPTPSPTGHEHRRSLGAVAAEVRIQHRSRTSLVLKRTVDVIGSTLGLLVLSPVFMLLILAVKLTSRGPAFFVQDRCGLGGQVFRFYKFRTMVVDAEARKAELEHMNEMKGPAFKIARDPRITKLGAILRKTSLDELPQLLNVLKGEMSLVGPRPPVPSEVERYDSRQAQRLSVIPGITGLWQVSGRSSLQDFDQWIELDLQYARGWSFSLDARILLKTFVVVLRGRGAH